MNHIFDYATERSEFYRERFGANKNAFTTSEDLRISGNKMLCVPPDEIARIVTLNTSGSSSAPKRVYFTERDLERTLSFFTRGMANMLLTNDRLCCLFPSSTQNGVGDLLTKAVRRIPVEVVDSYEHATFLVGSPAQILQLPDMPLRGALLSAEYVSASARTAIRTRFGCELWEHYGLTESGYGFAVSCCANVDFYHVRSEDLFTEIVDPVTGAVLPDGAFGEIVFTTLTREAMPLLRYRTGDVSSITRGICPHCGRNAVTLSRVGDRGITKGTRL
jgi:phenylacetate-coenzyme A ligase PaaK-like adenylate-forming protein